MNRPATPPLSKVAQALQWLLLGLVAVISQHPWRWILWEVDDLPQVFVGFRGVLLFPFSLALIALALLTLARLLTDAPFRSGLFRTTYDLMGWRYGGLWWLLLINWMALSALWAGEPTLARYAALHTLLLLGMALLLAHLVRQRSAWVALGLFVLGAVGQSALAVWQATKGDAVGLTALGEIVWDKTRLYGFSEPTFRGYGLTVHPNVLAGYLVIGLFGVIGLGAEGARWRQGMKGAAAGAGLLILLGLLATISRTGIMAAGVSLALLTMMLARGRFKPAGQRRVAWRPGLLALSGVGVLVALAAILATGAGLRERLLSMRDTESVQRRLLFAFEDTNAVIDDAPLWGVGENNLMVEIGRRRPNPTYILLPAHNAYRVVQAELGLPGLALFLLACGTVIVRLRQRGNLGAIIWGCCFLAICLIMLFDFYFWGDPRSRLLLFWVLGMGWGYRLRGQDMAA